MTVGAPFLFYGDHPFADGILLVFEKLNINFLI